MKDTLKMVAAGVAFLVVLMAVGWLATGNNFFLYKYFAPKQEQVRREVFEQSKAYRQGMLQELQNMQFEYIKADQEGKASMKSIILHRSADVPAETMPQDLVLFISQLKNGEAR